MNNSVLQKGERERENLCTANQEKIDFQLVH